MELPSGSQHGLLENPPFSWMIFHSEPPFFFDFSSGISMDFPACHGRLTSGSSGTAFFVSRHAVFYHETSLGRNCQDFFGGFYMAIFQSTRQKKSIS